MSDVRTQFEVQRPPDLKVRLPAGRVYVTEGDEGLVDIEVRGREADRFVIDQSGSRITVRPNSDKRVSAGHEIEIITPRDSNVEIHTASADVAITGHFAEADVVTASGDVRLASVMGDLTVKTASGSVTVIDAEAKVRVRTASGDVGLSAPRSEVQVSTASGDVELRDAQGDAIAKTASGAIFVHGFAGARLQVKTISGDVRLRVISGCTATIDLQSLSGTITLPEESEESSESAATGPNVRIKANSVSGDITISKDAAT